MQRTSPRTSRGFTLIELLVVVAVVALLLGLLLPALGAARRKAQLAGSVSNVRQITLAALVYAGDHEGDFPVEASYLSDSIVKVNSWTFGGKTNDDYWAESEASYIPIERRQLNAYLYDDRPLEDPEDGPRVELPVFQSPGDAMTLQREFWSTGVPDYSINSYDDVGTSYHMNVKWWYVMRRDAPSSEWVDLWRRAKTQFRDANQRRASRFIWLHDQIMDYVVHTGESYDGLFGGRNKCVAAFLDGHAGYVEATPGAYEGVGYTLIFDPRGNR
ncbi:MAG: prepilin-type N-terminal cleavage/methylation domain-containing protein [Phycisphaerales bacterium]|nr:prepilin-type N-terminal cleavage/methylation domain-containing protein [Phycisphaerales bacterium]